MSRYYAYDVESLGPYRVNPMDHYGLAVKIASGWKSNHLTREDIKQEALAALCAAARTYDPCQGIQFSTWAGKLIRCHLTTTCPLYQRVGSLGGRERRYLPKKVRKHFSAMDPSTDPSVLGPMLRESPRWCNSTDYD